ncbi:MAG: class II glutamine amidotransferase [Deltaproteobacteria bacterium]|nr:class II glutamine amidotransferase [Deltaproteobacteria bacterium]MBW2070983.1 class II glutamine amidotransferase [Deltaproteobacteria bacterium]
MCDLFTLSAGKNFSAPKSLPLFAVRASNNVDGWGIGYYKNHRAFVEKSADRAYLPGQLHDSFQRIARVVSSRIIICHLRMRSSGPIDECHAHPFVLNFAHCDWIFAHNGRAVSIESYRSSGSIIEEAVSDSARAFEYLRDHLLAAASTAAGISPLFERLYEATGAMIHEYPGKYNYLLTNGWCLFAFTNHRQFMVLRESAHLEDGLLLTTVGKGLSNEQWLRIASPGNARGLLLAIAGTDIILREPLR